MPFWLRYLLFFALLMVVLLATNFYVHRRASRVLGLGKRGKWLTAVLLALGTLAMVGGRFFGESLGQDLTEVTAVFGSTVVLGVLISVALLLPVDLLHGAANQWQRRFGRRGKRLRGAAERAGVADTVRAAPTPTSLGRRDFLARSASGTALVVGGTSSAYGTLFGRHDYRIEETPIAIAGLPTTLDGYSIVQLSDIHFGSFIDEPELRAAVALVQKAQPDLVVLTGDLLDHDISYAHLLGRLVQKLGPLTRDGVVAIPGNHDYYAGVDEVLSAVTGGGGRVLRNAGRVIGDDGGAFALLGVDDVWASRIDPDRGPDLARALSMVPRDLPRILLAHQPVFFEEAASEVALQLSGHTHGGQIQLGINPAQWVLPHGWVEGRYERDGATLYVNRGFGTAGPPARVGSPPEVTKIVLVSA